MDGKQNTLDHVFWSPVPLMELLADRVKLYETACIVTEKCYFAVLEINSKIKTNLNLSQWKRESFYIVYQEVIITLLKI